MSIDIYRKTIQGLLEGESYNNKLKIQPQLLLMECAVQHSNLNNVTTIFSLSYHILALYDGFSKCRSYLTPTVILICDSCKF